MTLIRNSLNIHRLSNVGYNLLILIVVWGPVIQMLMLLLKYSGMPYIDAAFVMKSTVAIAIAILLGLSLIKTNVSFIYISLLIFAPVLVGLINLTRTAGDNKIEFFIIHLAGSILILNSISAFSKSNFNVASRLIKEVDRSVLISLIITFLYLLIYSSQALSEYLYFGPSTGILLIAFPWFFAQKKIMLALFCFALIFMGGKRAVMVSVVFEMIILVILFRKDFPQLFITGLLKIIFLAIAIALLILNLIPDVDFSIVDDFWNLATNRIMGSFEGFSDDPNKISSGRFAEIEESFYVFTKSILNILFGLGFGWSFFWIDESLHFLHFSPLNFLYQYGIIIFSLFFAFFIIQIFSIYRHFKESKNIIYGTFFVIFLGQLVEGFFSYMYVVNPFMWCIFGLLIAIKRNYTFPVISNK